MRKSFRAVYKIEIATVFKRTAGGSKQFVRIAQILPTGSGMGLALGTCGKIGGIGNADMITARLRNTFPEIPQYTEKTEIKGVVADVFQSSIVGSGVSLNACDGAARIVGAKQHTQCAATGTKIQYPAMGAGFYKACKEHRVRT